MASDLIVSNAIGMYAGLSMAEYLAAPAASAGLIKRVVDECPRAAWFESHLNPKRDATYTKGSDAGTIAHEVLLEGTTDCVCVIDPNDHPAEKTGNIPDGWTNKSIKAARDAARAAGKVPVLTGDMVLIENMVDSAWHFIESLKNTDDGAVWEAFQTDGGVSEVSCFWEEDGLLCRMRPDRMDHARKIIIDPKFTQRSAEPATWSRTQMGPMGYWITAAMYRRGARHMFGTEPEYRFLVIEQNAPHLCSLVGVDPAGFDHGASQVEYGLRLWRDCVKRGYFPGYPSRTVFPEVMPWDAARAMEQQGCDEQGIPYDYETLIGKDAA